MIDEFLMTNLTRNRRRDLDEYLDQNLTVKQIHLLAIDYLAGGEATKKEYQTFFEYPTGLVALNARKVVARARELTDCSALS